MKKKLLVLLSLGSAWAFAAHPLDRTGTYKCVCNTELCSYGDFTFAYDRLTQYFKAEGKKFTLSGYFARQEAKTTGDVYLVTPETFATGKFTFAFSTDGSIRSSEADVSCRLGRE